MYNTVRKNASETMITKSVNPHNMKGSSPFFPLVSVDSFSPLVCGSDGGRYNMMKQNINLERKTMKKYTLKWCIYLIRENEHFTSVK